MLEKILNRQPKKPVSSEAKQAENNIIKIGGGRVKPVVFDASADGHGAFFDAMDSKKSKGKPRVVRHCK